MSIQYSRCHQVVYNWGGHSKREGEMSDGKEGEWWNVGEQGREWGVETGKIGGREKYENFASAKC